MNPVQQISESSTTDQCISTVNLYPVIQINETPLWTYDCKLPQLTFATIAILQPQLAFGVTKNKTDTDSKV